MVGKHQGAHYFTKGQRKGLAVGGTKEPLFVIDTDVIENVIYTGEGKEHKGLYRNVLFVANEEIHWIRTDLALEPGENLKVATTFYEANNIRLGLENVFRTYPNSFCIVQASDIIITNYGFDLMINEMN